jgi:hypothetical protein
MPHRKKRRTAVIAASMIAVLVSSVTPALAEGSWTSYIKDWRNGKESRRWQDNHLDRWNTTVAFSGCTFGDGKGGANIRLFRNINNWPDAGYDMKSNTCNTSNWGEMTTVGSYYFKYVGTSVISVDTVVVRY